MMPIQHLKSRRISNPKPTTSYGFQLQLIHIDVWVMYVSTQQQWKAKHEKEREKKKFDLISKINKTFHILPTYLFKGEGKKLDKKQAKTTTMTITWEKKFHVRKV